MMRRIAYVACFFVLAACVSAPPPPPSPTDDRFDARIEGEWRSVADEDVTIEIWRTADGSRYVLSVATWRGERRFRADLVRLAEGDLVVVEARGPSIGELHFPLWIEIDGDEMVIRLPRNESMTARLAAASGQEVALYCGDWGERTFCAPTLDARPREVLALLGDPGPRAWFEAEGEAWRRTRKADDQ
jgi:hypothetical protein